MLEENKYASFLHPWPYGYSSYAFLGGQSSNPHPWYREFSVFATTLEKTAYRSHRRTLTTIFDIGRRMSISYR